MSYFFDKNIPKGAISYLWSSGAIPAGWALCNGQTVTALDGSTLVTPNLIGMQIIGSDLTGGSSTANVSGYGSFTNQSTVGSPSHLHTYSGSVTSTSSGPSGNQNTDPSSYYAVAQANHVHNYTITISGSSSSTTVQISSYSMVAIIKL